MYPFFERSIFFISLLFVSLNSFAQSRPKLVYYDANWEISKEKTAVYLVEQIKINDTAWHFSYYNVWGPCIKIVTYKDAGGTIKHGKYAVYKKNGYIDTVGYYSDDLPDKEWNVMSTQSLPITQLRYDKGNLIEKKDSSRINQPLSKRVDSLIKKDSLTVFRKVEMESEFPGGQVAWLKYIELKIRYPDKAFDKRIKGMVVVNFLVDREGNVEYESIFRSVEYSLDTEARRIILNSPKWTPAIQNGRAVKSYKKQPIVFGF